MKSPPPIPQTKKSSRKKWALWVSLGVIVVSILCLGLYNGVKNIIDSGIAKGVDYIFGDQNLKTSVALIELHKVRYGHYPEKLSDIKHLGQWDKAHLQSVHYVPAKDLQSYYVEVAIGFVGKPDELTLPEDFWQGTGFAPDLKNKNRLREASKTAE